MNESVPLSAFEQPFESNPVDRQWMRQPTSDEVPLKKIVRIATNPQSIWSSVAAAVLVFVLTAIILVATKPNIVIDKKNGRVASIKVLFLSLLLSIIVFGVSVYLRRQN